VLILDFISLVTLFALNKLGIEYPSIKIYLLLYFLLNILVFLLRERYKGYKRLKVVVADKSNRVFGFTASSSL